MKLPIEVRCFSAHAAGDVLWPSSRRSSWGVINLKTAKALCLTLSHLRLLRARRGNAMKARCTFVHKFALRAETFDDLIR